MRKIIVSITFVVMMCTSSFGSISSETVNRAWKRIAKADGFKEVPINYEKDESPNAWVKFKSQNDFSVHVTAGLMKILNTEEEIAGVLGHEIGHVRLGHYNKGVTRAVGWAIAGALLGRIGGVGGAVAKGAGQIGANLAESGFSRGQEVEADDYGTELLKRAGYDPYGLYNAMKAFADNKFVTQPNGFNSHPPTERRLQHLQEKAAAVKAEPVKVSTVKSSSTKKSSTKKSKAYTHKDNDWVK